MADTMTVRDYLSNQVARLKEKADAITDQADRESRPMNEDEKGKVKGLLDNIVELQSEITAYDDNEKIRGEIAALGQAHSPKEAEQVKARTIGDAFVQSDAYQALKATKFAGRWTSSPVELPAFHAAAPDPLGTGDFSSTGGPVIPDQYLSGIQGPVEGELTVASLFGQGQATSPNVVYVKETETDNNAAEVAEKGPKPESWLNFDTVSEPLVKLATMMKVSSEALEDMAQLSSYLNGRLALFVRQAEESYLVTALAAAAQPAAAADIGGDNLFDAIMAGMTAVRVDSGLQPDAVLLSAQDNATLQIQRAGDTGGGLYFSGGPYAAAAQNPWGIRAVVSNRLTPGTIYVGAFRQGATLWRKGGLSVDATNSNEDDFQNNLISIRAEERILLTVFRDEAFQAVAVGS